MNLLTLLVDAEEKKSISFAWDVNSIGNFIATLSLLVIVYMLLIISVARVVKRKSGLILTIVAFVLSIAAYLFASIEALIAITGLYAAYVAVYGFANLGDLRSFIANPFRKSTAKSVNFGIEKIYDRDTLYKQLESAVLQLSSTRTGAIITFEKNTSLKDIMKNGVPVHAPVSSELLLTIFYPGTRLHDGAVVIHGNEIVAASVFFTPSTAPFAGKYGSRHRAAIGVSEVSDAITVVVSEETGRISIASNGELQMVDQSKFLMTFETYMADSTDKE
ncbi:MAG: diadenylate cyclase [Bacilli bacterium]|nr:diadenylate cyclase [Bacilli bacterium]